MSPRASLPGVIAVVCTNAETTAPGNHKTPSKPALLRSSYIGANTLACLLTPEVKLDDPFQFTMAVLESLSYARSAFRPTTLPVNSDALMQISDMMFRIKAADLDYGCAMELLRGYQKSKEPVVSLSAMHAVSVYESVIDLDRETVALLKTMIGDGAGRISPGDLVEKMADIRLRKSEQWDTISLMILGITGTLASDVPDSNGKASSLRITTQQ